MDVLTYAGLTKYLPGCTLLQVNEILLFLKQDTCHMYAHKIYRSISSNYFVYGELNWYTCFHCSGKWIFTCALQHRSLNMYQWRVCVCVWLCVCDDNKRITSLKWRQMSVKTFHFTYLSNVCCEVCSGWYQTKHQRIESLAHCEGNPPVAGRFPSQRVNNVEIVYIAWWHDANASVRRHD